MISGERSAGSCEHLESLFEELTPGAQLLGARHSGEAATLHLLEAVLKHRTVHLFQNVRSYPDYVIRRDPEDVPVECCVMEFAQGKSVCDHRFTEWMTIRENVCRFEKLGVPELTDRATLPVCSEHAATERLLVQANHGDSGDVRPLEVIPELCRFGRSKPLVVNGNTEDQTCRIVADNVHRPYGEILALYYSEEVDERHSFQHRAPHADIVRMLRIAAAVAVPDETIRT